MAVPLTGFSGAGGFVVGEIAGPRVGGRDVEQAPPVVLGDQQVAVALRCRGSRHRRCRVGGVVPSAVTLITP